MEDGSRTRQFRRISPPGRSSGTESRNTSKNSRSDYSKRTRAQQAYIFSTYFYYTTKFAHRQKNNKKNKHKIVKKNVPNNIGCTGRFFQSCMDQETITALGAKPLEPWLARVDDVVDKATLAASLVQMAVSDMNVFWSWSVSGLMWAS